MANDSHASMDEKKLRHAMNYGFEPFAIRRWIYVPQVSDRRNFRFTQSKSLHWDYKETMRFFEYEYFVDMNKLPEINASDVFAMLDMYDGITLVREENDKCSKV